MLRACHAPRPRNVRVAIRLGGRGCESRPSHPCSESASRARVRRVVVNGSFVTDKLEPNDVDCVLLIESGFPHDAAAEAELVAGLPFINFELVDGEAFRHFTEKTYATDRNLVPKGMLEVLP